MSTSNTTNSGESLVPESGGSRIVFLTVPPSLKEDIKRFFKNDSAAYQGEEGSSLTSGIPERDFVLDESVPLPVEIEAGKKQYEEKDLSWEMILSAMIKLVSAPGVYGIEPEQTVYYRRFVLALKPEIYHELSGAAIIKARNGDFAMALEIITLLEGLFPGDPRLLLNKALILEDMADARRKKDHEDAKKHDSSDDDGLDKKILEAYENALSHEQIVPEALFNAGFFFLRRREYRRARECFSDYLSFTELEPEDEEKQAQLRRARKKALVAIRNIESNALDDDNFLSALDLVQAGEAEEGLLKIKIFLEKKPLVWNGWFVLGWALRMLGRWQDGLVSYKKAVELGGGNSDTLNEMAICYMELGDLPAAQKELENALKEEPENVKIISNLGVAALKSGNNELAAGFFRTVLELDPEDMIAKNFFESRGLSQ